MIARTFTHEQMEDALLAIAGKMAEELFKLLIVDSVICTIAPISPVGELSGRQQRLGQFMSKLSKLADEFNLAIARTKFKVIQERWPLLASSRKNPSVVTY